LSVAKEIKVVLNDDVSWRDLLSYRDKTIANRAGQWFLDRHRAYEISGRCSDGAFANLL
jgi:hypothetical protein